MAEKQSSDTMNIVQVVILQIPKPVDSALRQEVIELKTINQSINQSINQFINVKV